MLTKESIKQVIISITRNELIKNRKLDYLSISYKIFDQPDFINKLSIDSLELINIATSVNIFFNIHKVGTEDLLLAKRTLNDWIDISHDAHINNQGLITFLTSGSTGTPKKITHNIETILNETKEILTIIGNFNKIISLVPAHHIYGFIYTIVLPQISEKKVSFEFYPKLNIFEENDLIVAVPEQWHIINNLHTSTNIKIKGTTSTGKINIDLYQSLLQKNVELYEFFGSTETLGIGYRKSPNTYFTPFSYITIHENKLYNNFTNKYLELMDELYFKENSFIPLKRKDNAVSIGGINTYLNEIEEKIKSFHLVKDCIVRTYETTTGTRLKSFIVPTDLATHTLEQITNYINKFPAHQKITNIKFGEKLPKNEIGKITDWN